MAKITVRFKYADDEEDVAFLNVSDFNYAALFCEDMVCERIVAKNQIKKILKNYAALINETFKEIIDIEGDE